MSTLQLNLIMLGPPGAGKGTQAERLAHSRRIPKISTGDILREAVHAGTAVGQRAKALMDRGELVSDEVMIGIVQERLDRADARPGFVLDGFPRTVAQAAALDGIVAGRDSLLVVDIEVPEAELVRRLSTRLICGDCGTNAAGGETVCSRCRGPLVQRADDNEAVVRERLKVYHRQSAPLVAYYRTRPMFRSVDGAQPADRVFATLEAAVDDLVAGAAESGVPR